MIGGGPRRLLRLAAAAALGLPLALAAVVYGGSLWVLARPRTAPLVAAPPRPERVDAAEARRFAILLGCLSCHGREGGGGRVDIPGLGVLGAPNLTRALPRYDDAELVRLLRYGVKRDGRTALGMPAATFYPLSDEDLGRLAAFLRTLPPAPDAGPGDGVRELSLRARWKLVRGELKAAADLVDARRPRWGELPRTTSFERGRYLASTICSECHGAALRGDAIEGSPSLAVVAGYDLDQFRHLLRTGEPLGGRTLGEMAEVARADFVLFTDQEVADLYAFLRQTEATSP